MAISALNMEILIYLDDDKNIECSYEYSHYERKIICRNWKEFTAAIHEMMESILSKEDHNWTVSFDYNMGGWRTGAHHLLYMLAQFSEHSIDKYHFPGIRFHSGDITGCQKMDNILKAFMAIYEKD